MINQKTIPTILAILFLLSALFVGVLLVQKGQVFFLRASPETTPNQIKITNLSNSSLTISWLTEKETSGYINFGESSSLGQTATDDRDKITGTTGSFQTHHVTLKNLKPKITYFFKIGSGRSVYDNSGEPYEITTAAVVTGELPPSDVASGTILKADSQPAEGAIVYLTLANMTPQSALVRSSGNWVAPLNTAFSATLDSYATYDKEAQIEEIFVQGGSSGVATAITTTKNDNPVGEIILGQSYDFRQEISPTPTGQEQGETGTTSPSPTPTSISSKFSFEELSQPTESTETAELKILSPNQDEKISTQKPEILGKGPVNQTIKIIVESETAYTADIKIDKNGNWKFTPPANLAPGLHTVKVILGTTTISHNFTVLAAGESSLPAFTATPSATIVPSPTPTQTSTPTPTPTSSGRTSIPATEEGVPTPGDLTLTFSTFILGLVLILSGVFVYKILAHAG